jgi:hypothetical protein
MDQTGATTMRTLIAITAIGLGVAVPAAVAEATTAPVTRAEVFAAAQRIAQQAAAKLEDQSASGIEEFTNGAARVDRSRTSFGNYIRYGKRRQGVSFALFGTNTVNGEARTLWCVGNVEVVRARNGRTRVAATLDCPVS